MEQDWAIEDEVVFIGSSTIDRVHLLDRLPTPAYAAIIISEETLFGGRGVIPAITFARLGGRSMLVSPVGYDFSSSGFASFLAEEGIDTALLAHQSDTPCPVVTLYVDSNSGETLTLFRRVSPLGRYTTLHQERIYQCKMMYISYSGDFESEMNCLVAAQNAKVPIVANLCDATLSLGSKTFLDTLIASSTIISMNEGEWENLRVILKIHNLDDLFALSDCLECVYQTCGERPGNACMRGPIHFTIPIRTAAPVRATVGAGDTFIAGAIYALCRGANYIEAAKFGSVLASFKVEGKGALIQEDSLKSSLSELAQFLRVIDLPDVV